MIKRQDSEALDIEIKRKDLKKIIRKIDNTKYDPAGSLEVEDIIEITLPPEISAQQIKNLKEISTKLRKLNLECSLQNLQRLHHVINIPNIEINLDMIIQQVDSNQNYHQHKLKEFFGNVDSVQHITSLKLSIMVFCDKQIIFNFHHLKFITQKLPNLKQLCFNSPFGGNLINQKSIKAVSTLGHLKTLKLLGVNPITSSVMQTIADFLPYLEEIQFQYCFFQSAEAPVSVKKLRGLKRLWACTNLLGSKICGFTTQVLLDILLNLPNLININLQGNNFTFDQLSQIFKNFPKISAISLRSNSIDNNTIHLLSKIAYQLSELNIISNKNIDDLGVNELNSFYKLKILNFRDCRNLGDASAVLISSFQSIQNLDISSCGLTNRGIIHLRRIKQLKRLSLVYNKSSQEIVLRLLMTLVHLRYSYLDKSQKFKNLLQNSNQIVQWKVHYLEDFDF